MAIDGQNHIKMGKIGSMCFIAFQPSLAENRHVDGQEDGDPELMGSRVNHIGRVEGIAFFDELIGD